MLKTLRRIFRLVEMGKLSPLSDPVYFIQPHSEFWSDLYDGCFLPDPDTIANRFVKSADIWAVQTYLQLRRRGLDVHLRGEFVRDCINVVMNYDVSLKSLPMNCYLVLCRADGPRLSIGHHTIVQNELNVLTNTDHFIPHWPQPGLLVRNASRSCRVENLVFKGSELNIWLPFRDGPFRKRLAECGITLRLDQEASAFSDYSNSDVAIAVRDLTEIDYHSKPASKLVNAWHAGVPILLGPEPAFRALRRSDLDYIEVRTPDDAITALVRLQSDPGLYQAIIENGFSRAKDFTADQISMRWHEVLAGPVSRGFSDWKRNRFYWHAFVRPIIFMFKVAQTRSQRRRYVRQRDHGFRPMSRTYT